MLYRNLLAGAGSLALLAFAAADVRAELSLQEAVQLAVEHAPLRVASAAAVEAGHGQLRQAGNWPDPTVMLGFDNRLEHERSGRGRELGEVSVTQPLPVARLGARRLRAEALLDAAVAAGLAAQLDLEHRAAQAFHRLQLATAELAAARAAADDAAGFLAVAQRRQRAGDLSRREALRLEVFAAQAAQRVELAEGKRSEALQALNVLLGRMPDDPHDVELLDAPPQSAPLGALLATLEAHPELQGRAAHQRAATADLADARRDRWPDFALSLYREREAIDGGARSYQGIGFEFTLPLWDRRGGHIQSKQAAVTRQSALARGQRLELESLVRVRHAHLQHLIRQAGEQRVRVLAPSRELLDLTRQAYQADEVDLLGLLDASEAARAATLDQQSLLAEAWLESAALRQAAGELLTPPMVTR